jgi:predicted lipoprotein with Yx(FWY)xxD motif
MKKSYFVLAFLMVGIMLTGAGCNKPVQNQPVPEQPANTQQVSDTTDIKLMTDSKVGEYFTDSKGMTLYIFAKDSVGKSVCEGQCLALWPIFYAENIKVPSSLDKNDFGDITRADGKQMTTYKGWPLYYFIKDQKPGDLMGDGIGNVWHVVSPVALAPSATNTDAQAPTTVPSISNPTPSNNPTTANVCPAGQYSCPCATGNYCLRMGAMCLTPSSPCPVK